MLYHISFINCIIHLIQHRLLLINLKNIYMDVMFMVTYLELHFLLVHNVIPNELYVNLQLILRLLLKLILNYLHFRELSL